MTPEKLHLDICLTPALIHNYDLNNTSIIIIDIIRASSSICTAMFYGVQHIIARENIDDIKKLKEEGYLIAGERNGEKLEGFDYGNSPIAFMDRKLEGKKLAITTTNGTSAIDKVLLQSALSSNVEIVIGGFVNFSVLKNYLYKGNRNVVLLCSGWKGGLSIEDTVFAGKLAFELMKSGKYKFISDAAPHAILIYEDARSNYFNFIMDNSVRFSQNFGSLSHDIRYSLKEDVAPVIPYYVDGQILTMKLE
ncbi:MAG: 2-phosphosulfolactate phosphatase [Bacteroidales bacterium]